MNNTSVEQIEAEISELSLSDQLWLMERLAHQIRQHALTDHVSWESQLAAMASDPDIQRELEQIETEFASTNMGGLDTE